MSVDPARANNGFKLLLFKVKAMKGSSIVDQQQLREHLDQLNDAIDGLDASVADKGKLSDLIVQIERQLVQPVLESEPPSLVDQVEGMVSAFENDHPTVSGILNRIMVTLTSMGV